MNQCSDNKITIWGAGSTRTMRLVWTALELGLDFTHKPIGSRTGETLTDEYTRLNPKQKIPTLQHGSLALTESPAIVNYLVATFPPPKDFFVPANPAERARLDEWCYFVAMELDAHSLYLIRRHDGLKHIYGEAPEAVKSAQEYFLKQINAVVPAVAASGNYLMGERFSVADILLMSCVIWAILYEIPLPQALLDYHQRVAKRWAYQRMLRINFPDWFKSDASLPDTIQQAIQQDG